MLHKNTWGEEVSRSSTVPSRIGRGGGKKHDEEEGFLATRTPLEMTGRERRGTGSGARFTVNHISGTYLGTPFS